MIIGPPKVRHKITLSISTTFLNCSLKAIFNARYMLLDIGRVKVEDLRGAKGGFWQLCLAIMI